MADRRVLARRAAERAASGASPSILRSTPRTVGNDPSLRIMTDVHPSNGHRGRRSRRAGRDKGQGMWRTVSANNPTGRFNAALSDTVTTMPRGERYAQPRVKIGAC